MPASFKAPAEAFFACACFPRKIPDSENIRPCLFLNVLGIARRDDFLVFDFEPGAQDEGYDLGVMVRAEEIRGDVVPWIP